MLPSFEIWLDNQLPSILAKWMQQEFDFSVKSAYSLEIRESSDWEIFQRARQQKNVFIISKDGDFAKLISQHGVPPKLIKLNTGNLPYKQLWALLQPILKNAVERLQFTDTEIIFIEPYS